MGCGSAVRGIHGGKRECPPHLASKEKQKRLNQPYCRLCQYTSPGSSAGRARTTWRCWNMELTEIQEAQPSVLMSCRHVPLRAVAHAWAYWYGVGGWRRAAGNGA